MERANRSANGVLRRKLRAEPGDPAEEQSVSPAKAVRVALARASDQSISLALRVGGIRQNRVELADALEMVDESWALFPIVHDDGNIGAICANPAAAVAFVEKQTIGQLKPETADARELTRTDRALTQPVADMFLRLFDETLQGAPTAYWTQGYRCEDAVQSRHMLALKLDANEFRAFDINIEFLGSDRQGQMLLLLPIKSREIPKSNVKNRRGSSTCAESDGHTKLREAALPAQVELEAVLCRVKLPLSQLRGLTQGSCLTIPRKSMEDAALEDLAGQTSFPVHLGQLHGARAVRVKGQSRPAALPDPAAEDVTASSRPMEPDGSKSVRLGEENASQSKIDREAQADAELDAMLAGG